MIKSWILACWFVVFATMPSRAGAPVAAIQSMLAKPKILCGHFDQSKQLMGLKKPMVSNGRFCVVAKKGVLWRTVRPFPNTIRLTRDEIVQLQGDRVTMRLDAKQEPAVRMINSLMFALLAGDLEPIENLFEVNGKINDNNWSVTLKAREPALAKIISGVALDGAAYVKNIVLSEASGDHTRIVFSRIETGDAALSVDEAALF